MYVFKKTRYFQDTVRISTLFSTFALTRKNHFDQSSNNNLLGTNCLNMLIYCNTGNKNTYRIQVPLNAEYYYKMLFIEPFFIHAFDWLNFL